MTATVSVGRITVRPSDYPPVVAIAGIWVQTGDYPAVENHTRFWNGTAWIPATSENYWAASAWVELI